MKTLYREMFKFKEKILLDCDELVKTDLTCPICSETYDGSHHLPKLLNHCHSICAKCLEKICTRPVAAMKGWFPCPICRRQIYISKGGVSGFQNDPYLNYLLDRIDTREVTPECHKHPLEELQYCEPCDALFCDSCDDKFHCNSDLPKPKHVVRSFSLAIKRKSETLAHETNKWISVLDGSDKTLAVLEKRIEEKSRIVQEENDLFFVKIYSLLNKRHQEISISIRETCKGKLKCLNEHRQWIKDERSMVMAKFRNIRHQGSVVEVKKKIEELQLRREIKKSSLIPKVNCSLSYVEDKEVMKRVQEVIESCYGFWTNETFPSLCEARVNKCLVGMRTSVTIVTRDFSGNHYSGNDLDALSVTILGPNNSKGILIKIIDTGDGTYEAQFVTLKSGTYRLEVTVLDCPIKSYPLKFEAEKHENFIFRINDLYEEFSRSSYSNTECIKLAVNQKEVRVDSFGWTIGLETVPLLSPKYCQLLDPRFVTELECAASLSCSKTAWICGGGRFCQVNSEGKIDDWMFRKLSLSNQINCIALVPGHGLSPQYNKVDITVAKLQTKCLLKNDISINKARSEVTFRFTIEKLSQMSNTVISPPVYVRNIPWRIYAKLGEIDSVKALEVYLECRGCPESLNWSCKAEAELRVLHQNADKPLTRKIERVFKPDSKVWEFRPFALNDVLHPEKGFIKDDSVILEVRISADTPQEDNKDLMEYTRSVQSFRTIWLGSSDKILHILSAEDRSVYSSIELPDSVIHIIHNRDKVFIALANGHCCVFVRSRENFCWNCSEYFLVTELSSKIGKTSCFDAPALSLMPLSDENSDTTKSFIFGTTAKPKQNLSISCMEAVNAFIWLAQRNSIHILNCDTLRIVAQFKVDDEKAQIDKMTTTGEGVWFSLRSQSNQSIQLFSAMKPYGKILSIDIRPDLRKMLIPSMTNSELDFLATITALKSSNGRLWVGTAAGVILCILYKFNSTPAGSKCDLSQVHLSLHGFGGAVKFFIQLNDRMISGGQGYRDLMIEPDAGTNCVFDEDCPYMLVW